MDQVSRDAVIRIVRLLVAGDYRAIEEISKGVRLSAADIERAVRDYGRTLIMPGVTDLTIDVFRVERPGYPTWSVVCDLWTKEEGRSDLSLEMTVIRRADCVDIEVDNIHVL